MPETIVTTQIPLVTPNPGSRIIVSNPSAPGTAELVRGIDTGDGAYDYAGGGWKGQNCLYLNNGDGTGNILRLLERVVTISAMTKALYEVGPNIALNSTATPMDARRKYRQDVIDRMKAAGFTETDIAIASSRL